MDEKGKEKRGIDIDRDGDEYGIERVGRGEEEGYSPRKNELVVLVLFLPYWLRKSSFGQNG